MLLLPPQSRPPPKNPLPARFFQGAQLTFGWLLPHFSHISYLIITFKCYSVLQWRSMIQTTIDSQQQDILKS